MNFKKNLWLLGLLTLSARAAEPSFTEVILDASGSMLGEVKGETKINTAKKMLGVFVQGLEAGSEDRVAIRTFGSRDGTCKDILLKLDFYKKDVEQLSHIVGEVNPHNKAMTPLAKAMEMGYKDLKEKKGKRNLIVFTDGEETCGGDPCKMAKKLMDDIDVHIFLVAYGVKKPKEFLAMKCLVNDQKGLATNPSGAPELADALAKIRKELKQTEQTILVKGPDASTWATAKRLDKTGEYRFVAGIGTNLEPGDYKVVVEYPVPYTFGNVPLKKNEIKILTVAGDGTLKQEFQHPLMKLEATHQESGEKVSFEGTAPSVSVPSGRYTVVGRTSSGLVYQWPSIMVTPYSTAKLGLPPWGILNYETGREQPYRYYRRGAGASGSSDVAAADDPDRLPVKKVITEREPDGIALSNQDVLLEEGNYLLVFANGSVQDNVKIRRAKTTKLP